MSIIDVAANPFCQKVLRAISSSASSSNCRAPTMGPDTSLLTYVSSLTIMFQGLPAPRDRALRRHREQLLFALPLAPGRGLPRLAGEWRRQDHHGSDRIGRGEIETRFALEARQGPGHEA